MEAARSLRQVVEWCSDFMAGQEGDAESQLASGVNDLLRNTIGQLSYRSDGRPVMQWCAPSLHSWLAMMLAQDLVAARRLRACGVCGTLFRSPDARAILLATMLEYSTEACSTRPPAGELRSEPSKVVAALRYRSGSMPGWVLPCPAARRHKAIVQMPPQWPNLHHPGWKFLPKLDFLGRITFCPTV